MLRSAGIVPKVEFQEFKINTPEFVFLALLVVDVEGHTDKPLAMLIIRTMHDFSVIGVPDPGPVFGLQFKLASVQALPLSNAH